MLHTKNVAQSLLGWQGKFVAIHGNLWFGKGHRPHAEWIRSSNTIYRPDCAMKSKQKSKLNMLDGVSS